MIGGVGVGATVHYYRELVKAHLARGFVANLVIVHADVDRVLKYAAAAETVRMADYFLTLIHRLSAAGAQIIAIPATTAHPCAPELMRQSPVPLVSLVDEIVLALRQLAHTLIKRDHVEAIILAGTELSLIFNPSNLDFPYLDGARLHLDAIMSELLGSRSHEWVNCARGGMVSRPYGTRS